MTGSYVLEALVEARQLVLAHGQPPLTWRVVRRLDDWIDFSLSNPGDRAGTRTTSTKRCRIRPVAALL